MKIYRHHVINGKVIITEEEAAWIQCIVTVSSYRNIASP